MEEWITEYMALDMCGTEKTTNTDEDEEYRESMKGRIPYINKE